MALNNYIAVQLRSLYVRERSRTNARTHVNSPSVSFERVAVSLLVFPNVEATASFN